MSDNISSAEKRKLLRERRAAKLAQGGNRLTKIVGSNNSHLPADIESTSEQKKDASVPIPTSTSESSTSSAAASSIIPTNIDTNTGSIGKTNRISQSFHDDPPVSSLEEFESIEESVNEFIPDDDIDVDNLLSNILSGGGLSPNHDHAGQGVLPPDFMKTFSSMMSGMGEPDASSTDGLPPDAFNMDGKTSDELAYEKIVGKAYKAQFAMFRYICVFILLWTTCIGTDEYSPSFTPLTRALQKYGWFKEWTIGWMGLGDHPLKTAGGCKFWTWFVVLEAVFALFYLAFANIFPGTSDGSIISKLLMFVPVKYKNSVHITLKYGDIVMFSLKDLCLVVVVMGLCTYYGI